MPTAGSRMAAAGSRQFMPPIQLLISAICYRQQMPYRHERHTSSTWPADSLRRPARVPEQLPLMGLHDMAAAAAAAAAAIGQFNTTNELNEMQD